MGKKAILSWSGGKDSALALYETMKKGDYEIVALLTTLTEEYDRTCMHGVRRILLERQADALGIGLEKVFLSAGAENHEYESRMQDVLDRYKQDGVGSVIFGDIFLEDLRTYREEKLKGAGMQGVFPLWKKDTAELAQRFMLSGFEARITCVDSEFLGETFAGKKYDEEFLKMLPLTVDPCGENGEFHSFVYNGPVFSHPITLQKGEVVLRDKRFFFCDLIPV